MMIPPDKCGLIIGKGGNTLKTMMQEHSVKLHLVQVRAPKYDLVVLSRTEYEVVLGRTEYEYDRKKIESSTSQYEIRPFYFKRGRTSTRSYWYEVVLTRTTKKYEYEYDLFSTSTTSY